jgi:general secretion pathway protein D
MASISQFTCRLTVGVAALLLVGGVGWRAFAQSIRPATQPAAGGEELVSLNLPDNAPLKVLLEYVSQEFGINILYDETVASQRVTVKAPVRVPKRAVPMLLDGALKMKGLALVDAEQPGWKRVVPLMQAAKSGAIGAPAEDAGTAVLTQVFPLRYADAGVVDANLKPFLTANAASSFAVPEQGLLVVTDYTSNLRRVAELIKSVDQPAQAAEVKFFPVKHADAARLTQQLEQILKARLRAEGGEKAASSVEVGYDARTSQVAVIGPKESMAGTGEIVASLDLDVPAAQSPVRFYKLANTTAAEVLATIQGLEEEEQREPTGASPDSLSPVSRGEGRGEGQQQLQYGAAMPRADTLGTATSVAKGKPLQDASGGSAGPAIPSVRPVPEPRNDGRAGTDRRAPAASSTQRQSIRTKQARITADPNTNSIIVIAPPDAQRLYEQLIRQLDKRRPQVLIECTIVTVDTTGDFQLGVEIGGSAGSEDKQVITFSQFGLSTPDPTTGRLKLVPGLGFNGALVSEDIADVVVRALESNSRARVSSAPRILVNDNNTGTLTSVTEFPYASVNASDTVATTSFGDYSKAGTEITVRPHISEADYLQLEYSISLSSFTGDAIQQGGTLLPPPRKSDAIESQVTIPDGSTIIVGGLNTSNMIETIDRIPIVGRIPILEYLFSNRTTMDGRTTLFAFIRPVILRDDKFEDLKFLSERDTRAAGVAGDFPASEPLAIP